MTQRMNRSQEYMQQIAPYLEEWAERRLTKWQQFRNWSVQQVLWEYNLSFADIEDTVSIDGPHDQGIDAWYYDDTEEVPRLVLVQAKDQQIKREDFSKLKDGFLDLILPDRPGRANQSLREKAVRFTDSMPESFKLDIFLTSSVIAQQNLEPHEDGTPLYTEERLQVGESIAEASYYVRDIRFLVDNLNVIHQDPIDFTFTVDALFDLSVDNTRTVCAALKATELATLFSNYRQNLFRKNPRYYLLTSARNKEIVDSLQQENNAHFFIYSRTGAAADRESELIALRSNTQNPLQAEDWKANDQRQERWHDQFKHLPNEPWFYEIKRGVWSTEHRNAQEKAVYRIGSSNQYRKFTLKDLGQACYAFLGNPGEALDKAREIFNSPSRYEQVFPADLSPYQLLLPYLIFLDGDRLAKDRPDYTLQDGFLVKTAHIRFAVVCAVSRMLCSLADVPQGYLSLEISRKLVERKEQWMREFTAKAFDRLARKLANYSRNSGAGPRSIVRRNEWLEEAIDLSIDSIRERINAQREAGLTGPTALINVLPFDIH